MKRVLLALEHVPDARGRFRREEVQLPDNNTIMRANFTLEYAFKRSLGPILGRFFTSLRDGRIEGIRAADGRVMVPPTEYDPRNGEALEELIEVSARGAVKSWTWVPEPRPGQPLEEPFAFALIQLDGADTPLLHAVRASSIEAMSTGLRVRARWAEERQGSVLDIQYFEPEEGSRD